MILKYPVGWQTTTVQTNMDRPVRLAEAADGGGRAGSTYNGAEYYNDENHWWNFVRMVNCRDRCRRRSLFCRPRLAKMAQYLQEQLRGERGGGAGRRISRCLLA